MNTAGESCESILLLGTSRRQCIIDGIERSVEEWRRQWSANSHIAFSVEVADALCRRAPLAGGRATMLVASAADQLLVLSVPMESQYELLGLPRGTIEGAEIENAVLGEALRDLCFRLARPKTGEPVTVDLLQAEKLPQAWARYGLSMTVRLGADRVLLRARLFPSLLTAMLPQGGGNPGDPLASRRNAIGDELVPVHAWLGEAEVGLSELANLQIGDVILLDAKMADSGYLALPDGRRLAQIRLGSVSGRRAAGVVGKAVGQ